MTSIHSFCKVYRGRIGNNARETVLEDFVFALRQANSNSKLKLRAYCTISINSAGIVTRDMPAEILVSAGTQSGRDIGFFFGKAYA